MNKIFSLATMIVITLISIAVFTQSATAADVILDTTIKSVTVKNDKNGVPYVRFIIVEDKELNGIQYKADTVVMIFGSMVETAKNFSDGDSFKAIASSNEYKGRLNYNIVAFISE